MCRGKTLGSPFNVSIESPVFQDPRHRAAVESLSAKRLHGRFHNRHNANRTIAINQPLQAIRRTQGKELSNGSQITVCPREVIVLLNTQPLNDKSSLNVIRR